MRGESIAVEEERQDMRQRESEVVREGYGDKQYPVMVYIVSVVTEYGSLMHSTAGPNTIL